MLAGPTILYIDATIYCKYWADIIGILYGRLLMQSKECRPSSNDEHIFCYDHRYRKKCVQGFESVCLSQSDWCANTVMNHCRLSSWNQLLSFELNSVWCTLSLSKQEDGASKLQNKRTIFVICILSLYEYTTHRLVVFLTVEHPILCFSLNCPCRLCLNSPLSPSMIFVYRAVCLAWIRLIL